MTESEAKTKWCPMVRHSGGEDEPASNRANNALKTEDPVGDMPWNKCVASDCAMWVWDNGKVDTQSMIKGDRVIKEEGHCGLINK